LPTYVRGMDDIPVSVIGRAGATQLISSKVTATDGRFALSAGTVPQALTDLRLAQTYCRQQAGAWLGDLPNGQTLGAGVYNLSSVNLPANGTLTLTGDTSSVFIFNVGNNMTLSDGSRMVLRGVRPRNVYWNVGGSLSVGDAVSCMGNVLVTGSALVDGIQFGQAGILSNGSITLTHISAAMGTNRFYAPLSTAGTCAGSSASCTFSQPGTEMIIDGSFELNRCCPRDLGGLVGALGDTDACFWRSPTNGSADYFNVCANGTSIPIASLRVPALAQNSLATTGRAYAGIIAYALVRNPPEDYREYV